MERRDDCVVVEDLMSPAAFWKGHNWRYEIEENLH